ncbi:MAG: SPFH domain-containing protein [Candidatus Uhrbacteria bacterium]
MLSPMLIFGIGVAVVVLILILPSIRVIGPTEVGLVMKRFGAKLPGDNPIALNGEAGYQADLLMPGWRWKFWVIYDVQKFPWVQVPAGEIGVVIAQVGQPLPIGAKSATYKKEFGNFSEARTFLANGGLKGVQRPVLTPGSLVPIHPIAFLVITKQHVYGVPIASDMQVTSGRHGQLSPESFGLEPGQLDLVVVQPRPKRDDGVVTTTKDGVVTTTKETTDVVGIVTTLEGDPLPSGAIAGRLGGFDDVSKMEEDSKTTDAQIIEVVLGSKNEQHGNYQDFQRFIDEGGRIGLQHDPLLYGAYALNPFLVRVEIVSMTKVRQGEVAVVKAYVGLPTKDTSGEAFKHGSLVRPGHRGIWQEPLRTGKYPINPRCYEVEIVPTAILTLNWAEAVSQAHNLDRQLKQITAKSREGFVFNIDLQVQIHVPDTKAPRVISRVGTMQNLVNEVLQAAVGNHFRDKLQSMAAVVFIETRQKVQEEAFEHIKTHLAQYEVETSGVYIQDVVLPAALVTVLTQREIAHQEIETFKKQREAQDERVAMEAAKGVADMQAELAQSKVGIEVKSNNAEARKKEAAGEAAYIQQTGEARGAAIKAEGLGRAEGYKKQVDALGPNATALVNAVTALSSANVRLVPDVLVTGGGSMEGLAALLMRKFAGGTGKTEPAAAEASVPAETSEPVDDPGRSESVKDDTSEPVQDSAGRHGAAA